MPMIHVCRTACGIAHSIVRMTVPGIARSLIRSNDYGFANRTAHLAWISYTYVLRA